MRHIGSYFIALTCLIVLLGCSFAALSTIPFAHARGLVWLVGEPSPGLPACEEFYDKWDVPGAPSGILAMAGFGREVFAAKDCIDKNNVPMACKHWQGLLAVIDKMGPPLHESRGDIEQLMQEHNCEEAPAPASESSPALDATPDSQSGPPSEPGTGPGTKPDSKSSSGSQSSPAPKPGSDPGSPD